MQFTFDPLSQIDRALLKSLLAVISEAKDISPTNADGVTATRRVITKEDARTAILLFMRSVNDDILDVNIARGTSLGLDVVRKVLKAERKKTVFHVGQNSWRALPNAPESAPRGRRSSAEVERERQQITDLLRKSPEPLSPAQICAALNLFIAGDRIRVQNYLANGNGKRFMKTGPGKWRAMPE